jgi:hypothetical protein
MATQSKGAEMTKVTDIFGDTGEVIEREANEAELAAVIELAAENAEIKEASESRIALKESAKLKLISGIPLTAEEAQLLLG